MPTNEKTFTKEIRDSIKKAYPLSFTWKTNDRCTIGVPDVMSVIDGIFIALEVKFYQGQLSKTFKLVHGFSPQQRNFLERIVLAGGIGLGLIGTEHDLAYIVSIKEIGDIFYADKLTHLYKFNKTWDVKQIVKEAKMAENKPGLYQVLSSQREESKEPLITPSTLVYKTVEDKLIKIEWTVDGNDYVYQINIRKRIFMDDVKNHNVLLAQMIRVLSPIIPRDIQVDLWAPNKFIDQYTIKVRKIAGRPMAQKIMEDDVIKALLTMGLDKVK